MVSRLCLAATLAVVISLQVSGTLACEGFMITVRKIGLCKDITDSVVAVKNFSVSLSEDCKIIPSGCILTKSFTTAKVDYKVSKVNSLLRFEGHLDGCKAIENVPEEVKAILEAVLSFAKCPAKETEICDDRNVIVDISKYSSFMKLAEGRIRGEIKAQHDTGKTCVKFDVSVHKRGESPSDLGPESGRKKVLKKLRGKKKQ